jgi:hypothetical protein
LDVVITQRPPILELLSRENQPLLIRRDTLFVLDLGLDVVDSVARFNFEGDGFARKGLHKAGGGALSVFVLGGATVGGAYICTV